MEDVAWCFFFEAQMMAQRSYLDHRNTVSAHGEPYRIDTVLRSFSRLVGKSINGVAATDLQLRLGNRGANLWHLGDERD